MTIGDILIGRYILKHKLKLIQGGKKRGTEL
jgi:hypothetical protein